MPALDRRDVGVRLIVAYKATKALLEVALAVVLVVLAATGEIAMLREVAVHLRGNVASRWSLMLGRVLARLASPRGMHLVEIGLVLDAVVSAFEGWCLWRGYAWGAWVVVIATAAPLPLEAISIARAHRPTRVVLALVNVAIVIYLALRIAAKRPGHDRG